MSWTFPEIARVPEFERDGVRVGDVGELRVCEAELRGGWPGSICR